MSHARALPTPLPVSSAAGGAVAGVVTAAVTFAALLRPGFGGYVGQAVALVAAATAAGLSLFVLLPGAHLVEVRVCALAAPAAVIAFGATLVTTAFQVMRVSGDGLRGISDRLAVSGVLRGADYQAALVRCAGLVLIALACAGVLRVGTTRARATAATGALAVAVSFALTGHARTHGPAVVVVPCQLAHVLAAAAWWGGLLALAVAWRSRSADPDRLAQLVATFAHLMTGVIVTLLTAGTALALLYLRPWTALWTTAYGEVLVVKVSLACAVLAVAAVNHRRLVPRATSGDRDALRMLGATITAEQIALFAVLVITAVLAGQDPNG